MLIFKKNPRLVSERVRAGGADAFRLRLPGGAAVTEVMSYEVGGGRGGGVCEWGGAARPRRKTYDGPSQSRGNLRIAPSAVCAYQRWRPQISKMFTVVLKGLLFFLSLEAFKANTCFFFFQL